MEKLTCFLLKHKKSVIIFFLILMLATGLLIPKVKINYDLAKYLPEDSAVNIGINTLNQEFAYSGNAQLMVENISISEAALLEQRLESIAGISEVLWLDDIADISKPLPYLDDDLVKSYYQEGNALFTLTFDEDDYSLVTGNALESIRSELADYTIHVCGNAEESRIVRQTVANEMGQIMIWVIPICILILLVISRSWLEPLLYLSVIGVAVVVNMGTNIVFDYVSFITFSMTAVIQLAVSMDYSIFLCHRYDEERAKGLDVFPAIVTASKQSFAAIAASALTTICGFSALIFMQYGIGADIGLVLAKGVFWSFLSVILLLPVLLLIFAKAIDKTRHRTLINFSPRLCRNIVRLRLPLLILAICIVIPAYFGQLEVDFLYGDSSGTGSGDELGREKAAIENSFGVASQMVLLIPNGDIMAEKELADDLLKLDCVDSVQAIVTLADPTIPRQLLPTALIDNFVGENYGRMILNVNTVNENAAMFASVVQLRATVAAHYGDSYHLIGKSASISDIRDSVQVDIRQTNAISMLAVALIILISFRSLLLPVILVAAILGAIFINMAIPYFLGEPLVFIGYLIVSSLQLGATIDYAILMASRYTEARLTMDKKAAAAEAIARSGISVLTSGLILTTAGLAEAYLSELPSISSIGMLIGRGALLSALMVLLVLPALLMAFDKPTTLLTLRSKHQKPTKEKTSRKNSPVGKPSR